MSSSSKEMREWFDDVHDKFMKELENNIVSSVCVFQVPKSVSSAKPEAYTPQLVGLGPYQHLCPKLTEMERVKLDVVKKLHKELHLLSFNNLSKELEKLDLYVRACYHKFLDMDSEMLSRIMTIDTLFLFNLLCQHGFTEEAFSRWHDYGFIEDNVLKLA